MKYKMLTILILGVLITGMNNTTPVNAWELNCDATSDAMRPHLGTDNADFDFNNDGIVNLIDVAWLSENCTREPVDTENGTSETKPKKEASTKVTRRGGHPIFTEEDGSKTHVMGSGTVIQLEQGKILKFPKNHYGIVTIMGYRIYFNGGIVNIKQV